MAKIRNKKAKYYGRTKGRTQDLLLHVVKVLTTLSTDCALLRSPRRYGRDALTTNLSDQFNKRMSSIVIHNLVWQDLGL
jgi:hypothetical protein